MNRLILQQNRPEHSRANIISVLSGKGGVGKSMIAFNLAERVCAKGKRVLLIDGDTNFGNLHIYANREAENGLIELLTGQCSYDQAAIKINPFFHLLPASMKNLIPNNENLDIASKLVQLVDDLTGIYEIIIIDHASGISDFATATAFASDLNLLIVVPELTSIADSYGLFKKLSAHKAALECRILINRVEQNDDIEFLFSRFCALTEQFLGKCPKFFGHISEDSAMKKALAAQTPLAITYPEAIVTQDITLLAEKLVRLSSDSFPRPVNNPETINNNPALADIKE